MSSTKTMRDILHGLRGKTHVKQWTSNGRSKMSKLSDDERRARYGIKLDTLKSTTREEIIAHTNLEAQFKNAATIPAAFNALDAWPQLKTVGIWDQGSCGDCWAVSAVTVLTYRSIINSGKLVKLSPQPLVTWCTSNNSLSDCGTNGTNTCQGSDLVTPWHFLEAVGTVSLTDMPMPATAGPSPSCPPNSDPVMAFAPPSGFDLTTGILQDNRHAIQTAIMTYGPVQAAFSVFMDLQHYTGGVYSPTPNAQLDGGHAITLIGWGDLDGVPFWIVQNSWGADWGETYDGKPISGNNGGFFRMIMHTSLSPLPTGQIISVENNAYAGYAAGTPGQPGPPGPHGPSPGPNPNPSKNKKKVTQPGSLIQNLKIWLFVIVAIIVAVSIMLAMSRPGPATRQADRLVTRPTDRPVTRPATKHHSHSIRR